MLRKCSAHIVSVENTDFSRRVDLDVPVLWLVEMLQGCSVARFLRECEDAIAPTYVLLAVKLERNRGLAFRALFEGWTLDDLAAADARRAE